MLKTSSQKDIPKLILGTILKNKTSRCYNTTPGKILRTKNLPPHHRAPKISSYSNGKDPLIIRVGSLAWRMCLA